MAEQIRRSLVGDSSSPGKAVRLASVAALSRLLGIACLPVLAFPLIARSQQADKPSAAVVVQPGAPGERSKTLPPSTHPSLPPLSAADISFMQGMIMHHSQAVEMTALIPSHTQNKEIRELGAKISSWQSDEIRFMQRWLAARGQPTSMAMPGMPDMDMSGKPMAPMPGMLTPKQMEALRNARGAQFDYLFSDRDDSAPWRCIDHGQGPLRYRWGRPGCRHFQFRYRRGQYAAGRNQDHAKHVAGTPGGQALIRSNKLFASLAAIALLGLAGHVAVAQAQSSSPSASTPAQDSKAPAKATADEEKDPFAPQPAPPLPPGMTGSDTKDPRYTLKPGLYDAGEAAMGMKHLAFLRSRRRFKLPLPLRTIRRCRRRSASWEWAMRQRCPSPCRW